jgi:peroxiredoxin/glutaredoxin
MSSDLRQAIAWVSREVNSRALVVFSKTTCPFCVEAKRILEQELGAAYARVKVIELDALGAGVAQVAPALLAISGMTTVPNIFLEGESIGGCSELKALLSDKASLLRSRFLEVSLPSMQTMQAAWQSARLRARVRMCFCVCANSTASEFCTQAGAATIRVGEKVPNVKVKVIEAAGEGSAVRETDTADLLRGRNAVLFGVPAAFSPSCSDKHLPSYLEHMEALKARGVDLVLCMAVNDAFVMKAWATQSKALGKVTFVADGNGEVRHGARNRGRGKGSEAGRRAAGAKALVEWMRVHPGVGRAIRLKRSKDGLFEIILISLPLFPLSLARSPVLPPSPPLRYVVLSARQEAWVIDRRFQRGHGHALTSIRSSCAQRRGVVYVGGRV